MIDLLISLVVALVVLALVYWVVTVLVDRLGIPFPPQTKVIVQVVFAIIAVLILVKFGVPLLKSLV